MKTCLNVLLILLLVLSTTTAWGQSLLVDDFTGTPGTLLTAAGWVAHSGSATTPMSIASPGLTYTGYASSSIGNATSSSANGEDVNKAFTSTTTGSVYYALMVNASPSVTTTDYSIHFCQSSGATAANFYGRLFIQKDASGNLRFGLSKMVAAASASYTDYSYTTGTTYFIVVKYTFNTGSSTDDGVYMWVNPTLGGIEPTPTISIPSEGGTDATGLAAIAIRQFATTTLARFDGIRVGTTWASVTPAASSSPLLTVSPTSLSGFAYFLGFGPSTSQSYNLSGTDLTGFPGNITVTGSTNYEVSTDNSTFSGSVNVPYSTATLSATPVYVRLKAGLSAGAYNSELIANAGGGATTKNVTCNGSVTIGEPTNHATSFVSVLGTPAQTAIVLTWADAVGGQIPAGYLIRGSATSFAAIVDPVDGTPVADGGLNKNITAGVQTHTFTGLTANTTYYFKIYPYTNAGAAIDYKIDGTIPQATSTTNNYPALPMTENFDYSTGTLTAVSSGTWVNHSGTSNYIPVVTGSLNYTNYIPSGIGNSVSMLTNGEDVNRQFAQKTSGDVYASFLVNFSAAQANGDYFLHLREAPSGPFYGRVFARSSAGAVQFGISKFSTGASVTWGAATYPLSTTHLVVLKYSIVEGATNDMVYLFVNPTLGISEPSPTLTINDSSDLSATDAPNIGAVCLRQGTTDNASTQIIDGIMVATSWAEISPPSTTPTITVGSITGFGNVIVNTTSAEKSYSVSGINLTGDISIVPPAGFEISTGTGGSFVQTNPIVLSPTGGNVSSTIYVRFKPTLEQVYSGNITHNSSGATEKTVAVSGTGISGHDAEPTVQASNVNFTSIGSTTITVNWTAGNGASRIVLARSGSAVNSDPVDGTTYTANAAFLSGTQIGTGNYVVYSGSGTSVTVTGLTASTPYHFAVYEFNGSAGTQNYLMTPARNNQSTTAIALTIPYSTVASDYTQNFNTLPNSGTVSYTGWAERHLAVAPVSAAGMEGWYFAKNTGSGTNDLFHIESGGATSGGAKSYGVAGVNAVTERALGALASGTYAPKFGALITNNTGSTLNKFTITFTGEQWRVSTAAAQSITFDYKVGATGINDASGFVSAAGLNFTSPVTLGAGAALDGNDAANRTTGITSTVYGITWEPGAVLAIRWTDIDDPGSDHALAIDDLTFSAGIQPLANFYYKGIGDLHTATNWGENSDGTGANPTDFTTANQVFHVRNTASVSTTAPWTVGGAGSKIVIGNGTNPLALSILNGSAITGSVDVSANATLVLADATLPTFNSISGNSTVNYAQTGTIVVSNSPTYGNLVLTGGTKTFPSGNTNVSGNIVVDGVTGFTGSGALVLSGNFTLQNSTTMITGMSLTCNGSSMQTLSGNGTDILLFRLTHGNANGITLSTTGGSSNVQITGTTGGNLVLGANKITTASNYISILNVAALSRTSGYIIGNFRKKFDVGTSVARTFEIGDLTNYTPVSVTFSEITTEGFITASTSIGDHSQIGTSGIHQNKSVNRFWSLLNGGIVFDNYNAIFTFVAGDVDASANTDNFIVKRYDAAWFTTTVGTRTATTTQATGIAGFGDFAIGEPIPNPTITVSMNAGWNLVSVPVVPSSNLPTSLFPNAVSGSIWGYLTGSYSNPVTMENGQGYWAYYASAQDNNITGAPITTTSVVVPTGNRWVLIGSLTTAVNVSSLTSNVPNSIVPNTLWGYSGTYVQPEQFIPGKGYWVFVNQPCTLTISAGSLAPSEPVIDPGVTVTKDLPAIPEIPVNTEVPID